MDKFHRTLPARPAASETVDVLDDEDGLPVLDEQTGVTILDDIPHTLV